MKPALGRQGPEGLALQTTKRTGIAPRRLALLGVVLLTFGLAACGGGDDPAGSAPPDRAQANGTQALLASMPVEALSASEAQGLAFMREEEQLAHDVYAYSALRWSQQPVFARIASSELQHVQAVQALLRRHGLPDVMLGLPAGQFATAEFQTLHDELVARSALSLVDALTIGLQIEELDIRDIEAQMLATDNQAIRLVYGSLLRGSRNHLRGLMKALQAQGGSYVPQTISQAQFDDIVATPTETGP